MNILDRLVLAGWKNSLRGRIADAVNRFEHVGLHRREYENLIGEVHRFKRVCARYADKRDGAAP